MLSNLLVKSNIIQYCSDTSLARLTAQDLYSVGERTYRKFFDERVRCYPSNTLPTRVQNQEWDARLFWGDEHITMEHEDRSTWAYNLAEEVLKVWSNIKQDLNMEKCIELLWIIEQVTESVLLEALMVVEVELTQYALTHGYDRQSLISRIASLTEDTY